MLRGTGVVGANRLEDALLKELEDLREENKILRDSLVEFKTEGSDEEANGLEKALREISGIFNATVEQARESLGPGSEKVTAFLSRQMEEYPVPMLLAAFSAGYLVSRRLEKR